MSSHSERDQKGGSHHPNAWLELVPRRELEHARRSESVRVLPEFGGIGERQARAGDIEFGGVGDVKTFRPDLQRVRLIVEVKQMKALGKSQIEIENAVAADAVALPAFSGERVAVA